MRLHERGRRPLDELLTGPVRSAATARLARRLTDSGLAVAVPPPAASALSVMVVITTSDRSAALNRCLAALGSQRPVIFVDDGSIDPAAGQSAWRSARSRRHPSVEEPAGRLTNALDHRTYVVAGAAFEPATAGL
jgi:hypothetical protein